MFKTTLRSALLLSSLALFQPALAQNLPGTAIDTATVAADLQNLLNLAQQAYPSTLPTSGASGWRLYQGYTFKYFAATGIYVGIKDGQVFLLGGPYTAITGYGSVAAVASALQTRITNLANTNPNPANTTAADFGNLLIAKTALDLANTFSSITMEYGTTLGTLSTTAQIKLEVVGPETIGSIATTHMKTTITAGTGGSQTYDMWMDSTGTFQRLALGDFVYPTAAHAQLIGPGLISGFLIALSATDNAQVKAALSGEIQNAALSTKVTKRAVGKIEVDTIKIEVASGGASVTSYISDFGSFSMMTAYRSVLANTTSYIDLIDMKLK